MEAIVKAVQSRQIPEMEVGCIVASSAAVEGIERVRILGIPERDIVVVDPRQFVHPESGRVDRERLGQRLLEVLGEHGVTVVTQNGWLPLTPELVIHGYPGRIFNQHPGPPEEFGGKGMFGRAVHKAVLEFRRLVGREIATSVVGHYVSAKLDEGRVVERRKVQIEKGDTVESLQSRVLPVEHVAQISLLQKFVRGELVALEPERLVLPGEEWVLEEAKKMAREMYPRG